MNPSVESSQTKRAGLSKRARFYKPLHQTVRKELLVCGILSSVLYVIANVVTAMLYKGYTPASQAVSELSAIGAPTRSLWVSLLLMYSLLLIAFGFGVEQSAAGNRHLRLVGGLFIANAVIGLFWPPMHQREVLAMGGGTQTDTLHIVFTAIWGCFAMLTIGLGAMALGKRFRLYSIITLIFLVFFGVLTGIEGPKMEKNLPTPLIGVWERINIGVYMLWVVVLAILLLSWEKKSGH